MYACLILKRHTPLLHFLVNGTVGIIGTESIEVTVRENWGLRVVVRGTDGKEHILWGKDLLRCSRNPHSRTDPYDARAHNKWNRNKLRGVKRGTNVQYTVATPVPPPVGCVSSQDNVGVYVRCKVLRVIRSGCYQNVIYSVNPDRCIHSSSVKVTKRMLSRARRDNRLWGSGMRPPVVMTEKHVISPATYNHLRDWIFNTDFLELLKATEQSTQRGHCFAVREAVSTTYARYRKSATKAAVEAVSENVYRRVLGQKLFTKLRKDHCMCSTCLRAGWRGIWDNGRKLIKLIDECSIWEAHIDSDGTQNRHVPGTHLTPRLKRLWDFLRLELHLHVEPESEIGSHCLCLNLGSLADSRLNNCCRHHQFSTPPPPVAIDSKKCCGDGCSKRSKHHCKHCSTSLCTKHLDENICTSEVLPPKFGKSFVCKECSPKVESTSHKNGCASCDEIQFFKRDLMKVAIATGSADILGRAKNLCQSIDIMVAHIMRMSNQVCYLISPALTLLTLTLTRNPTSNTSTSTSTSNCCRNL